MLFVSQMKVVKLLGLPAIIYGHFLSDPRGAPRELRNGAQRVEAALKKTTVGR